MLKFQYDQCFESTTKCMLMWSRVATWIYCQHNPNGRLEEHWNIFKKKHLSSNTQKLECSMIMPMHMTWWTSDTVHRTLGTVKQTTALHKSQHQFCTMSHFV